MLSSAIVSTPEQEPARFWRDLCCLYGQYFARWSLWSTLYTWVLFARSFSLVTVQGMGAQIIGISTLWY
jgi:hypothetical protein